MKKLLVVLMVSGLFACATDGTSTTKRPTKKEQCDVLEGAERDGCLREVDRMQEREKERQKKRLLCNSRLDC